LPLYPYRCTQCGHKFEKIQSFSAEPETECPKCNGRLERPLTAPGLQFKGAGWYVNDYAPKTSSSSSEGTKSESKTDSKTDTKTETKTETKAHTEGASATPAAAPSSTASS
jgi:putative FmdB family regulatory protein